VLTCEEAEEEVLSERRAAALDGKEEAGNSEGNKMNRPTRTRERYRQAARRLAARGEVLVTQNGKIVDPSFAKGYMELKLPS
jgi:hypothetical protein